MLVNNSAVFARVIAAAAFIALFFAPVPAVFCEKLEQIGEVRVSSLNMRRAPDNDAPVIRVLEKGSEVRILKEDEKWLQVISDERIGYVYNDSKYLERYTRHRVNNDDPDEERRLAMARAKEIERRIRQEEKEVEKVSQKQEAVAGDLEKLDRRISQTKSELQKLMAVAEETSARIHRLEKEAEQVRADIREKRQYSGRRITALYKLYRLGGMNLLATADSVHDVFSRKAAIERVLAHDEKVLAGMAANRRRLSEVLDSLNEKRRENRRLARDYEEKISELAVMRHERKQVLASLEERRSDREQSLAYLRDAAERLDDTIKGLEKRSHKAGEDFKQHQGLLKLPVQGKIVSEFGRHVSSDSGVASYRNGIEIGSEYGEPVRAVFQGQTVFADRVRGFGRVLIVSHGEGYHTVYGRLEEMFSSEGEEVNTGQVIATVGDSGSRSGPCLYFEVRSSGNPVDPMKWLDKG